MYMYPYTYYPIRYYNPYRRCYGYQCVPYANFINSNYATTRQDIYNSGIMTDVIQQNQVIQTVATPAPVKESTPVTQIFTE